MAVKAMIDVVQMVAWSDEHGYNKKCECEDCAAITNEIKHLAEVTGLDFEGETE
jgi:hypothetical protein